MSWPTQLFIAVPRFVKAYSITVEYAALIDCYSSVILQWLNNCRTKFCWPFFFTSPRPFHGVSSLLPLNLRHTPFMPCPPFQGFKGIRQWPINWSNKQLNVPSLPASFPSIRSLSIEAQKILKNFGKKFTIEQCHTINIKVNEIVKSRKL